jgi:leukotriene-A4 hydrolase
MVLFQPRLRSWHSALRVINSISLSIKFTQQVRDLSHYKMADQTRRARDPNTLSNYTAWVSTRITANLEILFDHKKLTGNVTHQLKSATNCKSREILLDTSYLNINEVKVDGKLSAWELLSRVEPYGSALKIPLENGVELGRTIQVDVCHGRWPSDDMLANRLSVIDCPRNFRQVHRTPVVNTCSNVQQEAPICV